MNITFRINDNYEDCCNVRTKVFIEEQGFLNEFDDIDRSATHVSMYVDQKLVGCARIFVSDYDQTCAHFGRIALLKAYRGKGLGRMLLLELEKIAYKQGMKSIELSAQYHLKGFYETLEFQEFGESFYDETVLHIHMRKLLIPENKEM